MVCQYPYLTWRAAAPGRCYKPGDIGIFEGKPQEVVGSFGQFHSYDNEAPVVFSEGDTSGFCDGVETLGWTCKTLEYCIHDPVCVVYIKYHEIERDPSNPPDTS